MTFLKECLHGCTHSSAVQCVLIKVRIQKMLNLCRGVPKNMVMRWLLKEFSLWLKLYSPYIFATWWCKRLILFQTWFIWFNIIQICGCKHIEIRKIIKSLVNFGSSHPFKTYFIREWKLVQDGRIKINLRVDIKSLIA